MGEAFLFALMLFVFGGEDDGEAPKRDVPPRPEPDGPPPPPPVDDPNKPGRDLPDVDDPVGPGGEEPEQPAGELAEVLDDYPEPGKLYQVRQGDTGALSVKNGGIAHRAIATIAYRVATARGNDHETAIAFASTAAATHRTKYWLAIEGHEWNDRLYGTYGYGQQAMANPQTKRAIRLLPQNADNVARLAQKQAPIRSVLLSTPQNAKQGTGKAAPGAPSGHFELLYMPMVDEDLLFAGQLVILPGGPPQWVRALGVIDRSGAPVNTKWGA